MEDYLKEKFDYNSNDEDIITTFTAWKKESETYHNSILSKQKNAFQYYIGNQTDRDQIPAYLSNTVENRIYEAVETLVPIATANAHQFQVAPSDTENDDARTRALNWQKFLTRKYETLNIQEILEDATRFMLIMRFGVVRYDWDDQYDDVCVANIDPRLIFIPKMRLKPGALPYVMQLHKYQYGDVEEKFPDFDTKNLNYGDANVQTGEEQVESKKGFWFFEIWTPDTRVFIHNNQVAKKEQNPYYDYQGKKVRKYDSERKKIIKELKFKNHQDYPRMPFIFFAPFNIGEGSLPELSLVEIAIPIQDSINVQKRAIINNLKQMGNGQVYVDSEAMTEEEADNMTNEPGIVLRGKGLASENRIRREAGTQLPNAHFANLQHSESVFDNIMGVHSATRGAAQAKTLGQDILGRQQDFTRIDTVTRVLNRGMDELVNGIVQMYKMFSDGSQFVKILGEAGAAETVRLNQDDIDEKIEIITKSGVVLPMDEVSIRTEAVQLWQLGALDPVTLFERLKFSNPARAAQRLLAWKTGQLTQETMAKIAQAQGAAEASAANQPQQVGAAPTGNAPGNPTPAGPPGTETPMNVLQRARQSLGGSAPVTSLSNRAKV